MVHIQHVSMQEDRRAANKARTAARKQAVEDFKCALSELRGEFVILKEEYDKLSNELELFIPYLPKEGRALEEYHLSEPEHAVQWFRHAAAHAFFWGLSELSARADREDRDGSKLMGLLQHTITGTGHHREEFDRLRFAITNADLPEILQPTKISTLTAISVFESRLEMVAEKAQSIAREYQDALKGPTPEL